eukprot:TRINITY_DN6287_c0_g2_i2.p2 TRINITY_DN6287_c0_g2~~TRINITY_DN6287_c0_g2_i2.p2  ORF type:complete len:192 (-),score=58.66 TRINITY_DN6287_c0_g2_i2:455-1030(-)
MFGLMLKRERVFFFLQFPPSLQNPHYVFNMQHAMELCHGTLRDVLETSETPENLVWQWMHEGIRVFADRLMTGEERERFFDLQDRIAKQLMSQAWFSAKETMSQSDIPLMYSTIIDAQYQRVNNMKVLVNRLHDVVDEYNMRTGGSMEFVWFDAAVKNVVRLHRVFSQKAGSVLQLGSGGSGKKSVAEIAA